MSLFRQLLELARCGMLTSSTKLVLTATIILSSLTLRLLESGRAPKGSITMVVCLISRSRIAFRCYSRIALTTFMMTFTLSPFRKSLLENSVAVCRMPLTLPQKSLRSVSKNNPSSKLFMFNLMTFTMPVTPLRGGLPLKF